MGYIRHHAIIVTSWDEKAASRAHKKATALGCQVSPMAVSRVNADRSFCVFPDGSKEGWHDSNDGDERRDALVAWLQKNEFVYDDGSSPFAWVEVAYGNDDAKAEVTRDAWHHPSPTR